MFLRNIAYVLGAAVKTTESERHADFDSGVSGGDAGGLYGADNE